MSTSSSYEGPVSALHLLGLDRLGSWVAVWGGYAQLLGVGHVLAGEDAVPVDELVLGMPVAFPAAWAAQRWPLSPWGAAAPLLVLPFGLIIGLLAS
jgi:hypothetical protein